MKHTAWPWALIRVVALQKHLLFHMYKSSFFAYIEVMLQLFNLRVQLRTWHQPPEMVPFGDLVSMAVLITSSKHPFSLIPLNLPGFFPVQGKRAKVAPFGIGCMHTAYGAELNMTLNKWKEEGKKHILHLVSGLIWLNLLPDGSRGIAQRKSWEAAPEIWLTQPPVTVKVEKRGEHFREQDFAQLPGTDSYKQAEVSIGID